MQSINLLRFKSLFDLFRPKSPLFSLFLCLSGVQQGCLNRPRVLSSIFDYFPETWHFTLAFSPESRTKSSFLPILEYNFRFSNLSRTKNRKDFLTLHNPLIKQLIFWYLYPDFCLLRRMIAFQRKTKSTGKINA